MDISFDWDNIPKPEDQRHLTQEIEDYMLHTDIVPCHAGSLNAYVRVFGPLDYDLDGYVKCKCGRKIFSFKGNDCSISEFESNPPQTIKPY